MDVSHTLLLTRCFYAVAEMAIFILGISCSRGTGARYSDRPIAEGRDTHRGQEPVFKMDKHRHGIGLYLTVAAISATRGIVGRLMIPVGVVMSVALLAGCADQHLYNTVAGQTVRDLAVSPDGKHLLVAVSETSESNYPAPPDRWSVRLYDYETGKELKRLQFLAASSVAYALDGTVALCNRQEIAHWDPRGESEPIRIRTGQPIEDAVWLPGSRQLVSAGKGGMRLWGIETKEMVAHWGKGDVRRIAVSADGRRLVAYQGSKGRNKNSVEVWDLQTRQVMHKLKGYNYNYRLANLAISADGATIVVGMEDGHVTVWDAATGLKRYQVGRGGKVCDLAISPDGDNIMVAYGLRSGGPFTGRGKNSVHCYDVATGKRSYSVAAFSDGTSISTVAFSSDSRSALATVGKEQIYRWTLRTP